MPRGWIGSSRTVFRMASILIKSSEPTQPLHLTARGNKFDKRSKPTYDRIKKPGPNTRDKKKKEGGGREL